MRPLNQTTGTEGMDIETPQAVRDEGAKVQSEAFLRYMLGVDFSQTEQQITLGIVNKIGAVRTSMSTDELSALKESLDKKIDEAIQIIAPNKKFGVATEQEKALAVAQAVYEAIPLEWMKDYMSKAMPVNVAINGGKMSRSLSVTVTLGGTPQNILINTDHLFWRNKRFKDAAELEAALIGKAPEDVGITIPSFTPGTTLTATEASVIAAVDSSYVSISKTRGHWKGKDIEIAISREKVNASVDIDLLLASKIGSDAPPGLAGMFIAEINDGDLENLFEYERDGKYVYWEKFVSCKVKNPTDQVKVTTTTNEKFSKIVVQQIRNKISGTVGNPLGQVKQKMHELNHDVLDQLGEQQKFLTRLHQDSQNDMGAVMAAAMAAADPTLRIANTLDAASLKKEKAALTAKKKVHEEMNTLRELPYSFTYEHADNFEELEKEIHEMKLDKGKMGKPGVAWGSKGAPAVTGVPDPTTITNGDERKEYKIKIDEILSKAYEDQKQFKKIHDQIYRLKIECDAANLTSKKLNDCFVAGTSKVDKKLLITAESPADIFRLIENDLVASGKLESVDEIDKLIHKKDEELDIVKKGGLSGDDLQKKILDEYLKKKSPELGTAERENVINFVQAKTFYGHDMANIQHTIIDKMFDQPSDSPLTDGMVNWADEVLLYGSTSMQITCKIAEMCKVKVSGNGWTGTLNNPTGEPIIHWPKDDYLTLCTSYFALRRLLPDGGGNVPDRMRIRKTEFVKKQMKILAGLLVPRHLQTLERDIYAGMSDAGKQMLKEKQRQNKKLTFAEASQLYLSGKGPDAYQSTIDHLITCADADIYWKRNVAKGLYDYTIGSAPAMAVGSTIKEKAGGLFSKINNNKAKTAFLIGGSLIAGPVIAGAALLLWNSAEGTGGGGGGDAHASPSH